MWKSANKFRGVGVALGVRTGADIGPDVKVVGMARSPEMKMPETRAGEGTVLRLMYLVSAFAGINMQNRGSFLMSGMKELGEILGWRA